MKVHLIITHPDRVFGVNEYSIIDKVCVSNEACFVNATMHWPYFTKTDLIFRFEYLAKYQDESFYGRVKCIEDISSQIAKELHAIGMCDTYEVILEFDNERWSLGSVAMSSVDDA